LMEKSILREAGLRLRLWDALLEGLVVWQGKLVRSGM